MVFLPLALPLIVLVGFLIWIETGTPILYTQTRVGLGGRRFTFYKFRTLRADHDDTHIREMMAHFVRGDIASDPSGAQQQFEKPFAPDDITRIGRLLRQTRLDELPQLLNIARGDMSWVGPRPNVEYEVEAYAEWHHLRLAVLPGITGLQQVRASRLNTFDEMVLSDLEYTERQSTLLDLKIMLWTLLWICFGKAAP
jgi:lipopolysaccharide/colanic/teichoic acid biosynthesis glycosyltransferase